MKGSMENFTLTNNHLSANTDAETSTYVFHTSPIFVVKENVTLKGDVESFERVANAVDLDR